MHPNPLVKALRPAIRVVASLCLAATVLLIGPAAARAGAWTLPKGKGILIITSGRKTQPAGAMFGGVAEEDKNALQIYAEYGLNDRLTLGAVARAEMIATTFELDFEVGVHCLVDVVERLRFDPLGGVDNEESPFAGGQRARDFVGEIGITNLGLAGTTRRLNR